MVNPALESLFPRLAGVAYEITSPAAAEYNCLAWAAADDSRWWWPDEFGMYYWPRESPRQSTVEAFVQAYRSMGFEICQDAALEAGWEKIAIFAGQDGTPTHAARQLSTGAWTSKLGKLEDIVHPDPLDVGGNVYGGPVRFLRRPRS